MKATMSKTRKVGDRTIQTIPVVDTPFCHDTDNVVGSLRLPKEFADSLAAAMKEGIVYRLHSAVLADGKKSSLLSVSIQPTESDDEHRI